MGNGGYRNWSFVAWTQPESRSVTFICILVFWGLTVVDNWNKLRISQFKFIHVLFNNKSVNMVLICELDNYFWVVNKITWLWDSGLLPLTTKLHESSNISMDCRDACMDWPQHCWQLKARSVSCGPAILTGRCGRSSPWGQGHHTGSLSATKAKCQCKQGSQWAKGEFWEGMLCVHQERAVCL